MELLRCVFIEQCTAYDMRMSDGSSDVCSSDLADDEHPSAEILGQHYRLPDIGFAVRLDGKRNLAREYAADQSGTRVPPAARRAVAMALLALSPGIAVVHAPARLFQRMAQRRPLPGARAPPVPRDRQSVV